MKTLLTRSATILLALVLSLTACAVRETKPLAYPGDGRSTIASIEAISVKHGYKPTCKEREYCKMKHGEKVWIHFKASAKKVVLAIDVVGGKDMPADRRKALVDEATGVAEGIWREATEDTKQREIAAAEKAKADAAAKAEADRIAQAREEQARKDKAASNAANASNGSNGATSGGVGGILSAVGGVLSGGAKAPANAAANCCVNGAYYDCPSPSAVNKCAGEFAACVTKCAMGSDMGCGERCMKDHPPDPSGCTRNPSKDGTCSR
jgi:hypothetical protein